MNLVSHRQNNTNNRGTQHVSTRTAGNTDVYQEVESRYFRLNLVQIPFRTLAFTMRGVLALQADRIKLAYFSLAK